VAELGTMVALNDVFHNSISERRDVVAMTKERGDDKVMNEQ
jgi:hypothetical protein